MTMTNIKTESFHSRMRSRQFQSNVLISKAK